MPDDAPVEYRSLEPIGYPKYRVGSDGSVWSFRRNRWKRLQPTPNEGYPRICLYRGGRRRRLHLVHALVLTAFVGPCPDGLEACHENGDRSDCRLDNLRWDTHKSNGQDMIRHGRSLPGELSPNAKLTDERVREIRRLYDAGGWTFTGLGERFGINRTLAFRVVRRKSWRHVI